MLPPVVLKSMAAIVAVFQLVLIGLYTLTYLYVDKMERTGCACSVHPYRSFIRTFPMFAVVYLLITMFAPMFMGKSGAFAMVMQLLSFMFTIGSIIFFILAIKYIEYLIREKCKCSEDNRREMLYYWSIVHLALIFAGFLIVLLTTLFTTMTLSSLATEKTLKTSYGDVSKSVRNPARAAFTLPDRLKKLSKARR